MQAFWAVLRKRKTGSEAIALAMTLSIAVSVGLAPVFTRGLAADYSSRPVTVSTSPGRVIADADISDNQAQELRREADALYAKASRLTTTWLWRRRSSVIAFCSRFSRANTCRSTGRPPRMPLGMPSAGSGRERQRYRAPGAGGRRLPCGITRTHTRARATRLGGDRGRSWLCPCDVRGTGTRDAAARGGDRCISLRVTGTHPRA
jgi:hypothetical protein